MTDNSDRSGALIPNSYQTPNHFVDDLMHLLTPPEWKVLSFMSRHIFGWQDSAESRTRCMSVAMLLDGFVDGKGRWYHGTGLSRGAIVTALRELAKYGIVVADGKPGPDGQRWRIPADDSAVHYAELKARQEAASRRNAERCASVREARRAGKPEAVYPIDRSMPQTVLSHRPFYEIERWRSMGQNGGVLSDRTEAFYGIEGIKPNKTQDQIQDQTQLLRDASAPRQPPPKPPPRASPRKKAHKPAKPAQQQPPAAIKNRLAELCFGGSQVIGANWARLVRVWNRLEKPDIDQIDRFDRWWRACDWRGTKGQRPTPEQVVSEWDRAQNWDGSRVVPLRGQTIAERNEEILELSYQRMMAEKAKKGDNDGV